MDLELAPHHEAFRASMREFAQGVVEPHAVEVDRDHRFPEEAVGAARQAGLMGVLIPREYGGAGLDAIAFTVPEPSSVLLLVGAAAFGLIRRRG